MSTLGKGCKLFWINGEILVCLRVGFVILYCRSLDYSSSSRQEVLSLLVSNGKCLLFKIGPGEFIPSPLLDWNILFSACTNLNHFMQQCIYASICVFVWRVANDGDDDIYEPQSVSVSHRKYALIVYRLEQLLFINVMKCRRGMAFSFPQCRHHHGWQIGLNTANQFSTHTLLTSMSVQWKRGNVTIM